MTRNDKTPVPAGACHCVKPCIDCDCKSTTPRPIMGTALRAFLKRYLSDLRTYGMNHGDKITSQMVDCGEFLLVESDRQGGRP